MAIKTLDTQGLPALDELHRLPGQQAAVSSPKKARLRRKRPEDEVIAPDTPVDAGETAPEESIPTDELPPQPLEEPAAEDDAASLEGDSAQDAYSFVEADAWSADWTRPADSGDNILLAQAGGGGTGGGEEIGGRDFLPVFAGLGLLLLAGGGGEGGGTAGAASFADINPELGGTEPETVVNPATGAAHSFYIGSIARTDHLNEGFSRSLLPASLSSLAPKMVYDFRYQNPASPVTTTIDHTGLQVNMAASDTVDVKVYVSASANLSTESHLIWLGNIGVDATAASADAYVNAEGNARGGGDAEVGISNFHIDLAGPGTVRASADLSAYASGGSLAGVLIGNDVYVSVAAGEAYAGMSYISATAGTSAFAHVSIDGGVYVSASGDGFAEGMIGTIDADAQHTATAYVQIADDVSVNADAASGTASAYVSNISAYAWDDALARVDIGGSVLVAAEGSNAAEAFVGSISANATIDATAVVSIADNVSVNAFATNSGRADASLGGISAYAAGNSFGQVDIGGNVNVYALAFSGSADAGVGYIGAGATGIGAGATASGASASASMGNVLVAAGGGDIAHAHLGYVAASTSYGITAKARDGGDSRAVANVYVGNAYVVALASHGTADAYVQAISASAENDASAGVSIGDVYVAALGYQGDASAYVDQIRAQANNSASAHVTSDGGVNVFAAAYTYSMASDTGSGNAYASAYASNYASAFVSGITADAEDGGARATVSLGDVRVHAYAFASANATATANSTYASATASATAISHAKGYVGTIAANAVDADAYAQVVIGNLSVSATAQANANANANAFGTYATSNQSAVSSAKATAFVDDILAYAYAQDASPQASVYISGDVSVRAEGNEGALAYLGGIYAYASVATVTGDAQANVTIGEDVNVYAWASDGSASAYVDSISASAGEDSSARVEIGGSVLVRAEGSEDFAQAYIANLEAQAEDPDANAAVYVSGSVAVRATASDAYAFVDSIDVHAHNGADQAYVQVSNAVSVYAAGWDDAYAYIGTIHAHASEDSARATVDLGSVMVNAEGSDGAVAYIGDISASASNDSASARVSIAGVSVTAAASTYSGDAFANQAYAYVEGIYAYASDDNAYAQVLIDGDVTVKALAEDHAQAHIGYASSTYSGVYFYGGIMASAYSGGTANVSIYGNLEVSATATGSDSAQASALVSRIGAYVYAESAPAQASVYISGDVSVRAEGEDGARAYVGDIYAFASYGSGSDSVMRADVTIGGGVYVYASSSWGSATAEVGDISASAGEDAQARVAISESVSVRADGEDGAAAYLGSIGAFADDTNASAEVAIYGGVLVSATATSGDAYAGLGRIHVHADGKSADGTVAVSGSVSVRAEASGDAYAYVASIHADASYDSAVAKVSAGNVLVRAEGSEDAMAYFGTSETSAIRASATASGAQAHVYLGNVTVSAAAATYSGDAIADEARAYVNAIYAYATNDNAYAQVLIDGDLKVSALGSDYALAHIGFADSTYLGDAYAYGISASAQDGGSAHVAINGSVRVSATGTNDSFPGPEGHAYLQQMEAYAWGGGAGSARASVYVSDQVSVRAVGEDFALAYVGQIRASALSASSYSGSVDAIVTIGGGVDVYAHASNPSHNSDHTAYAYVSDISAYAADDGLARITIGHTGLSETATVDALKVRAIGEDLAIAYVPVQAFATSEDATAEVVLNGNMSVFASANNDDAYAMLLVGAGVNVTNTYSDQIISFQTGYGRVEINGNVELSATADGTAYAYGQLFAGGRGSVYVSGSVDISVNQSGSAWLDIYASNDNGIDIGNLNVYVGSNATADVYVQHDNGTPPIEEFLAHGSSSADISIGNLFVQVGAGGDANFYMGSGGTASIGPDGISWDLARTADLNGNGDVNLDLYDQIYGEIDGVGLDGAMHLEYLLGDHDFSAAQIASQDLVTTIVGFEKGVDSIRFNNLAANVTNFVDFGVTDGTFAEILADMASSFDPDVRYVYARYTGAADLNGGLISNGTGILIYDKDNTASTDNITAVLLLPNIGATSLTPGDINP
jgi:hypothetical protein